MDFFNISFILVMANRCDLESDEIYCGIQSFYYFKYFCETEWQLNLVHDVLLKL